MFTGIVEEVGRVAALELDGQRARLAVEAALVVDDLAVGGSIAVDGCCLTATSVSATGFACELTSATLEATALGGLAAGDEVNLERALPVGGRLAGHLVQGHVDGVGSVVDRQDGPGAVVVTVSAPSAVAAYLVPKGSIALAGVSLTILDLVAPDSFRVALIPHTLEVTTLGRIGPGDRVNLEADLIAKHVERLLAGGADSPYLDVQETG